MKLKSKTRYEFNRRFAKGEQYIQYKDVDEIVNVYESYFWQVQEVYNHILPIIEYLKAKYKNQITSKLLYGENGLVEQLMPIQRAYNALMNRSQEIMNRMCYPIIMAEDGSIDVDDLEDGLTPGKVLVYRQGAKKPIALETQMGILGDLHKQQDTLLTEFDQIVNMFEAKLKEQKDENRN